MKNVQDVYRLSPVQRELLTRPELPEARPGSLHWSFRQGLDEAALEAALRLLLARHTALRTAFVWHGMSEPMQVVRGRVEPRLERLDLSGLAEAEQAARRTTFLAQERRRAMTPTQAPLLRVTVLRTSPEAGTVVLTWHPLILDESSARRCLQELFLLYRAARGQQEAGLGRSRPYRDYIVWLERQDPRAEEARIRETLRGARRTGLLDGWLAGEAQPSPSSAEPEGEGLVQRFLLSPAATGQVQAFLRQHTLDLSTLLQAAWALLLHQHGLGDELLFGVLTGGPASLSGGDSLVGRFATLAPRRIQVARGGMLLRWLRGLQAEQSRTPSDEAGATPPLRTCLDVFEGGSLFDSVLTTDAEDAALKSLARSLGFHGLTHPPASLPAPLVISARSGPRLALRFHYDARRFASTAVARLVGHLGTLLEELALRSDAEPSALTRPPGETGNATHGGKDAAGTLTVGSSFGPAEVEAVLAQHPAVARVSVVPDTRAGNAGGLVAQVVPTRPAEGARRKKPGFGLFYFANEDVNATDRYRLYLEGARLADRNGFTAIWTPERHFDEHGGLYPNPAVLTAALAIATERIGLRAGSVVLPLHHPLRVAEDWSAIDNLSKGRVGMAVTSGWMPQDFALAPDHFANKRDVLFRALEQVRELWRGGAVAFPEGTGKEIPLRTFPRPVQPELPVWLTCPGHPELFEKAGELGVHVLTSLASQSVEEVRDKIALYRAARARAGHDPATGTVTVMLHTFVGKDADEVLDQVREPLTHYLRTHLRLQEMRIRSMDLPVDVDDPKLLDRLASFAFELHYRMSALIGTPTSCLPMVDRLAEIGADELACFIDFGVDENAVLAALSHLVELKQLVDDEALRLRRVLTEYLEERLPGHPPVAFSSNDRH